MATWHALALSSSSRHLAKSVLRSNTTSCQMVSYLRTSACCSGRRKMPNSERKGANTTTSDPSSLFIPIPVKHNPDDINIGAELAPGPKLEKQDLMKMLTKFFQRDEVRNLCRQEGLDNTLYHQAYISFRRFCLESEVLPPELHIVFSDVLQGAGHVDDIFPYFLKHAKLMFPHLSCIGELKQISDLRNPVNWYPEARAISRRVIFHAGPTNSGKTYHALESFLKAKSGIYCGPLKLLAQEVFRKSNERVSGR
ncbi:unnamed protein product [Cyprideis torosa]|uniref:Suv3 N-terminal domain-containing protein n=1 Tax=Cyprideis torosa TaxID=163714 RepID=A0A7R8WLD9_9CRUS|nr:unnamed protein product [Cyprideis torosa]CAG0901484.1 unnamed protein product [Cyprideis torosa]